METTKDMDNYDEFIEPDKIFDQIFSFKNEKTDFEDKIIKRVEELLEDKNKKILELEEKVDKIINFNKEIIKNKEIEIANLKHNFDEFKIISNKKFESIQQANSQKNNIYDGNI